MSVKVVTRVNLNKSITGDVERAIETGLSDMAEDIVRLSQRYSPVDSGNLVTSHKVDRERSSGRISYYISANTPYATRRHFENRKNPQTLRYLERAGDQNAKNPQRYFR